MYQTPTQSPLLKHNTLSQPVRSHCRLSINPPLPHLRPLAAHTLETRRKCEPLYAAHLHIYIPTQLFCTGWLDTWCVGRALYVPYGLNSASTVPCSRRTRGLVGGGGWWVAGKWFAFFCDITPSHYWRNLPSSAPGSSLLRYIPAGPLSIYLHRTVFPRPKHAWNRKRNTWRTDSARIVHDMRWKSRSGPKERPWR